MSDLTKITAFSLAKLNNAEYLAFMNSVLSLLPPPSGEGEEDIPTELALVPEVEEKGSPDIGLTAAFVTTMEQDVLALADAVDESRTSQETAQAAVHEENRDNLALYILTRITRSGSLPLAAERDAGKFLYNVVKPYIGVTRLPVAQESAKLQGLLIDLRKEENAPYVTTLGLDGYIAELETENNAYIALTTQRTQNRAAAQKESGGVLRPRIDAEYAELALLAQSYNVVRPTSATKTFVANLNQLIAETVAAYNSRSKQTRKGSTAGGSASDAPGEL